MAAPQTTADNYCAWKAKNWQELRAIWKALDAASPTPEPHFHGELLTAQQAGWVFERFVLEAFRWSGFAGHYPFSVPMTESGQTREQLDGLVFADWQGFLIESKFIQEKIDFGPIARLHVLVEQRLTNTVGLFFSAFGYTTPALASAELLRPIRVLLFETADVDFAMKTGKMRDVVWRKWKQALKYAHSNLPVASYDAAGEFPPCKGK